MSNDRFRKHVSQREYDRLKELQQFPIVVRIISEKPSLQEGFHNIELERGLPIESDDVTSITWSMLYSFAKKLHNMHKHNFFHYDIKPPNIILTDKTTLKLIDFEEWDALISRNDDMSYINDECFAKKMDWVRFALIVIQYRKMVLKTKALIEILLGEDFVNDTLNGFVNDTLNKVERNHKFTTAEFNNINLNVTSALELLNIYSDKEKEEESENNSLIKRYSRLTPGEMVCGQGPKPLKNK